MTSIHRSPAITKQTIHGSTNNVSERTSLIDHGGPGIYCQFPTTSHVRTYMQFFIIWNSKFYESLILYPIGTENSLDLRRNNQDGRTRVASDRVRCRELSCKVMRQVCVTEASWGYEKEVEKKGKNKKKLCTSWRQFVKRTETYPALRSVRTILNRRFRANGTRKVRSTSRSSIYSRSALELYCDTVFSKFRKTVFVIIYVSEFF